MLQSVRRPTFSIHLSSLFITSVNTELLNPLINLLPNLPTVIDTDF